MKNKIGLLLFFTFFYLSIACCYSETSKIIFISGEWPPATSEKLPGYGFITEIVTAACQQTGIIPEYKFLPWKRAEAMVKKGIFFGTFPFMVTEERKKDFYFSDTLFNGVNCFVYYDKNPKLLNQIKYEKLEDLRDYIIGMISGTSMEVELKNAGLKVEVTATLDQSLKKLSLGRIDLYLTEQMVFQDAIERLFPDEVKHYKRLNKPYGAERPNAIMVSKNFSDAELILKRFNQGLQMIKENGDYDRIASHYIFSK